MGRVPRSLLVLVTLALLACGVGGFVLGLSQTALRHAAAEEEEAPIVNAASSTAPIKDAQPLTEPPPPAPKPKKAEDAASSDNAPLVTAPPLALPPLPATPPPEAAPGAPPSLTAPQPKLPADLPPT